MNDSFSKIIAILLAVTMMFIVPVSYMKEETERLKQTKIISELTQFVDGIRNTGIIGREDYERFNKVLYSLGGGYRIDIEHARHMYDETGSYVLYQQDKMYEAQIMEIFSQGMDYFLGKNDYLKMIIKDKDDKIIAWYGGSIKYEAY